MPLPKLNHTMFRVKDAKKSLAFYTEVLGMELLDESPGGDFTNYFLAFPIEGQNLTPEQKKASRSSREGVLELCHNWGTESDPEFKGYSNGNSEPGRGFGHICYAVDDLQTEVDRLTKLNVNFKKRPEEGRMRHIAFILDPDNYWIEIINNNVSKM
ncbi:putative lactoylglutathione lyase [Pseudohyphozyma bogoriensis]|nr:putative lactoylglutathione lyase [Pseudohyphozyma bogoriensis]